LWWGVVQRNTRWVRDPVQRRAIGGVYLAFLLMALMGLFAQVGGVADPLVWRLSFILIAPSAWWPPGDYSPQTTTPESG
jgi:hypothetical protein